jgi:hypothetical protein
MRLAEKHALNSVRPVADFPILPDPLGWFRPKCCPKTQLFEEGKLYSWRTERVKPKRLYFLDLSALAILIHER